MEGVPGTGVAGAPPTRRRALGFVASALSWATAAAVVLGLVGQVVRDRNVPLALMMYIPLAPLGLWAVCLDLLRRGRSLRPPFLLCSLGAAALLAGLGPMLGRESPQPAPPGATPVTLLHWNVQSGGRRLEWSRWEKAAEGMMARAPDVIVLSETPPDPWLFATLRRRGNGWNAVQLHPGPGTRYWYNLLVCSRWPLKMDGAVTVRNGAAMAASVTVRGRPVRLLVVDGMSTITLPRTPFLHDVAAACDEAARAGRPYDLVVGDFNAVGRSIGFDAVRTAGGGYRRASDHCGGWRGTWPVPIPLYDIDHVMARTGVAVTRCEIFTCSVLDTDHRGHWVTLALP